MTPFASLCFLSFNRPQFIGQAIETAIENAGYPVEVIVHDDGSNDETVNLLLELRRQGMISTLLLNQPGWNEGQGIALNRMFHLAKGDPICKLDHDLVFAEGWLAKSVRILEANETASSGIFRQPGSEPQPRIGALGLFPYHTEPVNYEDMLIDGWGEGDTAWEQHQDFVGSAMVIPREAWEHFGPFQERSAAFAEDHDFKMRVTTGKRNPTDWAVALTPEQLVHNQGFGEGPSTVVVRKNGELTSRAIRPEPYIIEDSPL